MPKTAPKTAEFEPVTIARKEKPNVEFTGRLLGSVESRNFTRSHEKQRDRWTRFQVWETSGGNWVVANLGCSDREGEIDIGDSIVLPEKLSAGEKEWKAMEFFGWTWLAKNLAEKMGWETIEVVS